MKIYILLIISFSFALFSCEETIILDTRQVEPALVVDAHLTDEQKIQNIKLSQSVDFYYNAEPPAITNAQVIVYDVTADEIFEFIHNPTDDQSLNGVYFSNDVFQGYVGHTYELQITWNDQTYRASETMPALTEIDTLKYRINPFEFADPEKPGLYYELLLYAHEPQETTDYYLFEFFRNDSLVRENETAIYFTDDKFLQENIKDLPSPIYYRKNDKATLRMYSITEEAFIFLNDLFNILNNDSGMFSPPPANPRNNISNGALGYFMVSSVESVTIVIN
ncbi:MAG: DUF4249 domain-containing protein [Candidatus Cyclobacteriaceae bacterium M2_1C_046]